MKRILRLSMRQRLTGPICKGWSGVYAKKDSSYAPKGKGMPARIFAKHVYGSE